MPLSFLALGAAACTAEEPTPPPWDENWDDVDAGIAREWDSGTVEMDAGTTEADGSVGCTECDGCCREGRCYSGRTATACGNGGMECFTCGDGFECNEAERFCAPLDGARFQLTIVDVSLPADTRPNGDRYDRDSGPDPTVVVYIPGLGLVDSTRHVNDTLTAEWNEPVFRALTIDQWLEEEIVIEVMDHDAFDSDLINETTISLEQSDLYGQRVELVIPGDDGEHPEVTVGIRFSYAR